MHRLKLSGAGSAHNRTTCLTFFWCCICRWQVVVWQGFTIPGRYGQGGTWILFSTLRILNFVNMYNCHYDNQISLVELTIIILLSRTSLRWGLSSCVIENYLWEKIRVPIIGPKVLKKTKFLEHLRDWEIHFQNILNMPELSFKSRKNSCFGGEFLPTFDMLWCLSVQVMSEPLNLVNWREGVWCWPKRPLYKNELLPKLSRASF